ncbi:MAG: NAD(P)-dependent oxidoreductase [Candidatus Methylacidiphilales bacterium]|nr:NAD(P)-dependent oxidoreductase [Candidatus Methylacidiphilales bacterium]
MAEERVLLTGSSGTLGFHLLQALGAFPEVRVLALLRAGSREPKAHASVRFERVDFFDQPALSALVAGFRPTCLIHCAASGMQFPKPQWFDLVRFNVDVSLQLCEAASAVPGCRLVFVGTGLAYRDQGRPLSETDPMDTLHPYGASKAAADLLMRSAAAEFGVPLVVVRPFSFTGQGDDRTRLFPTLLRSAQEKKPLQLSPGDQVRDHCAGEDVAAGILAAAFSMGSGDAANSVYNLGSGRTDCLRATIEDVVRQIGLDIDLRFGERPYAPFEPMFLAADITRAGHDLGWRPRKNLAFSVWQLAQESFPGLKLEKPQEWIT